jgi:hypothetical protein
MPRPKKVSIDARRIHRRVGCALSARWSYAGAQEVGCVQNLSMSGFCLRTRSIHPPGFTAVFEIYDARDQVCVEARVTWAREIQAESSAGLWHEMGLALAGDPPAPYQRLVLTSDIAGAVAELEATPLN